MHIVNLDEFLTRYEGLAEQSKYATLESSVEHLQKAFSKHAGFLRSLRIWMVSSTERGGGVAEMLPRIIGLIRSLGVETQWLIIDDQDRVRQQRFFQLTKYLHNTIHDSGAPLQGWRPDWVDEVISQMDGDPNSSSSSGSASRQQRGQPRQQHTERDQGLSSGQSTPSAKEVAESDSGGVPVTRFTDAEHEGTNVRAFRYLFEAVNNSNADEFLDRFCSDPDPKRDLVIIHDPQPAAMILRLRQRVPQLKVVWRCHIGLDVTTPTTVAAWSFLKPYVEQYNAGVWSAAEYIPDWMKERGYVVHPGISPLAPKNKELSPYEVTQVLMRCGLMNPQMVLILQARGCELIDRPFSAQARIYEPRRWEAPCSPVSAGFHPAIEPDVLSKLIGLNSPPSTPMPTPSPTQQQQQGQRGALRGQPQQHATTTARGSTLNPARSGSASPQADVTGGGGTGAGTGTNSQQPPESPLSTGSVVTTDPPYSSYSAGDQRSIGRSSAGGGGGGAYRSGGELTPRSMLYGRTAMGMCFEPDLLERGIAFLHRPIVTQISRWDRLKGFKPLMEAWVDLKTHQDRYVTALDSIQFDVPGSCLMGRDREHHRRMLRNACLVLAGPDPRAIADDPEGLEVLQELKNYFDTLPKEVQRDIKIVELPMADSVENAIIVNAIQRASNILIQNSSREGFGLTATEALFKRVAFIGTQAVGLRVQVRHLQDGYLVQGDPTDPKNVARALNVLLGCDQLRHSLALNGQKRAMDRFLVHRQLEEWIKYCLVIMGAYRGHIRRTVSAPDIMTLLGLPHGAVGGGGTTTSRGRHFPAAIDTGAADDAAEAPVTVPAAAQRRRAPDQSAATTQLRADEEEGGPSPSESPQLGGEEGEGENEGAATAEGPSSAPVQTTSVLRSRAILASP